LEKSSGEQRRWIVTDAVFSMDGDLAPLKELCEIAERFDSNLIVDEAHGTGVFGPHGRGVCEALGVEERVFVRIGTLSKAIGTLGGFVSGSNELVEYLWNRSRTQIYSTALPAAVCAAAIAAFDLIDEEPERRTRLANVSEAFRKQLSERGVQPLPGSQGPIVPITIADPKAAIEVASRLLERGFLVGAIRPPTVPRNTSRLRIVVTVAHSDEELARLATTVAEEIQL
jgi:7-keto-8-aminopelargonate synthetase-like enzyme